MGQKFDFEILIEKNAGLECAVFGKKIRFISFCIVLHGHILVEKLSYVQSRLSYVHLTIVSPKQNHPRTIVCPQKQSYVHKNTIVCPLKQSYVLQNHTREQSYVLETILKNQLLECCVKPILAFFVV